MGHTLAIGVDFKKPAYSFPLLLWQFSSNLDMQKPHGCVKQDPLSLGDRGATEL